MSGTQRKLRKSIQESRPPIIFIPPDYAMDKTGIEAMAQIFGRGAIMVTDLKLYSRIKENIEVALNQGCPGVHRQ